MIRSLVMGALIATPFATSLFGDDAVYTHPGIVVSQGGQWVGSDHLLNLTNKIQIVVEILKPGDVTLPINVESIKTRVGTAFKKLDINPEEAGATDTPNIPFFNVLIVVYPIEKGFVALIDGRLVESVDPLRVKLEKGTIFQAITWEKKTLVVAPTEDFKETVDKTVDELVRTFLERYEYFEKMKLKLEKREEVDRLK